MLRESELRRLALWWGIFAPAKTPQFAVAEINGQINKILERPKVREIFEREGVEPAAVTPEQFTKLLRDEQARWRKVVEDSKFEKE